MIARRSLCPEKLGSNPGQGSKGINFSGWHGLDMSVTVTKRRYTPTNQLQLRGMDGGGGGMGGGVPNSVFNKTCRAYS